MTDFAKIAETAIKYKKKMLEKQITFAKTHCPHCGGQETLIARIIGRKNHFHMRCTNCGVMMME